MSTNHDTADLPTFYAGRSDRLPTREAAEPPSLRTRSTASSRAMAPGPVARPVTEDDIAAGRGRQLDPCRGRLSLDPRGELAAVWVPGGPESDSRARLR